MLRTTIVTVAAWLAAGGSALAQDSAPVEQPDLVLTLAVDQFSADLFAEHRDSFTGGLKRLSEGVVFPAGYQAHAATETCPGHATLLTGVHPARSGIIANDWIDLGAKREDKEIYCAEDATVAADEGEEYRASAVHLLVPTLGERLKKISPKSRNVAVAGKDRSALMMAGNRADGVYWWGGEAFVGQSGQTPHAALGKFNEKQLPRWTGARAALPVPAHCERYDRPVMLANGRSVGAYRFERGDEWTGLFRASPDLDRATLELAGALIDAMELGRGDAPDMLAVGLSATDYIGHGFGTEGIEMCLHLTELDAMLGEFFSELDSRGIDYLVVLTADHGGHDIPERLRMQGVPDAARIDPELNARTIGERVRAQLQIEGETPLLHAGGPFGDWYIARNLDRVIYGEVKATTMALLREHPQVAAVLDGEELAAMAMPTGPVESWTLVERARASYYPLRSGDMIVLLDKTVTPIAGVDGRSIATHGSPWDYDRRVPMLFWRKGMAGYEQPLSVATVDIAPTLAPFVGVKLPTNQIDGRCLDLDAGEGNSCE